jgi:hypothetical protein
MLVGCTRVQGMDEAHGGQEHRNADRLLSARHLGGTLE